MEHTKTKDKKKLGKLNNTERDRHQVEATRGEDEEEEEKNKRQTELHIAASVPRSH